ncbi:hypothetical protein IEQ34_007882 [Dendrobium chrysotoxum]|uniref:Large ribosomal subunit protein uL16m n=1 Tax=Dendrobium chrysotoxum TaxID=161865 RepID=A0AAV7H523_DENCH|nr:hypothetical protein IEQ34_007882 [Dendrobium chrysotoxum]
MSRQFRRNGKIWVKVLADLPITGKPAEVRMGRGKGNPTGWMLVCPRDKSHLKWMRSKLTYHKPFNRSINGEWQWTGEWQKRMLLPVNNALLIWIDYVTILC